MQVSLIVYNYSDLEVYCKGIILWYHIQVVLFIQFYTLYIVVIVQQSTCCLSVVRECMCEFEEGSRYDIIIPGRPHAPTIQKPVRQDFLEQCYIAHLVI